MKANTQIPCTVRKARLSVKLAMTCVLLALAAPLAAVAQQTVFYDTFGSSTINGGPTTNMIPGGTPTASFTSYEIGSGKNATATAITAGNLSLITAATSAGNTEAQALFTKYPVTLASIGDYIELDVSFTDTTNVLNGLGGNQTGPLIGLYNSGGVAPHAGTLLWNGGFGSATTASTGGTKNWLGYVAGMYHGLSSASAWTLGGRPAQTTANNTDQQLLFGAQSISVTNALPASFPFPNLAVGSAYTAQLRITLSAAGALTVSNALFPGVGTAGTAVWTNSVTYAGTNLLATNFDGLAVGARPGGGGIPWTNDFNSITVLAGLAAQAGPYYFVTSSGNPCAGGLTIGLSGSVATNVYLLYTNGVYNGQAVTGSGSAISFGFQSTPATYTVIASNSVTTSQGPMLGSAGVFVGVPSIIFEPASVAIATNLPATFSVTASGNSLTYQWYKNGVALTNGGDVSGAETATLTINPAQAADAATTANGYYVVTMDACGNTATSSPNAALTLLPPNNLVWQGNNNSGTWDVTNTVNFLNQLSASAEFTNGDNVTFNDTSLNTTVTISNNVVPTVARFVGTLAYTVGGPGQITGFGQLVDGDSGLVTIINKNGYTGGTVISNGATLSLGNGVGTAGSVGGVVTVNTGGVNQYNYAGTVNANGNAGETILEAFAGSGTVNFMDQNGAVIATTPTQVSSNFNGTVNIQGFTSVHAVDLNNGYPLGNGSTINVPANAQVWLDRSATAYNNTFNISGTGWLGTGSAPSYGALRCYIININGPINLINNATIGGSSSGPTIQSVISGNYQLELFGVTNTTVFTMGPTNGAAQAYASTLITSGSILAANTNAISTGPLTLDSGGDLRLNGYNITVSNLSSINSGRIPLVEGPRIRNMNATNSATLIVGTDGTSTSFGGTFSDGAAASFGLNKIGAGTLTLTAVSTNTGIVTVSGGTLAMSGSGAFTKASQILAASGAIYDVTGAGGTLTLNSGQLVGGNGTVNGTVVGSAGSVVAPGLPMGTLTTSGSCTVNGIYRANLNRTNTLGNCSQITSSGGSVTFSGATLSATNVGPVLQVGDTFQLFSGATAGFTASQLQTTDTLNNAIYTWNNNVSTSGNISVASVMPITIVPTVPPKITNFSLVGANVSITATNGVNGGTYYLLSTTNLTLPTSQWTSVATNVVTASGGSATFNFAGTNVFSAAAPQKFFMLSSTNN